MASQTPAGTRQNHRPRPVRNSSMRPPHMSRSTAFALPALLLVCGARAAPAEPIQQVEVTAGAQARRSDPVGRVSVARADIVRYGDGNLSAVLKRQPGISVANGEVRMRGLGAGYTQILINGEPVAAGFSIDSIAASLIDRIDILRTGSAEFGSQAIAGTINIILRKTGAQRELSAAAGLRPGRIDPGAALRLGDQAGPVAWSLAADLSRSGVDYLARIRENFGDKVGEAAATARATDEEGERTMTRLGLAPRINWNMANGDTLAWQALVDHSRETAHGSASETLLRGQASAFPENGFAIRSRIASARSDLTWTHQAGAQATLLVKAGVNRNRRDNAYVFTGTGPGTLVRKVDSNAIDNAATLSGKYLAQLGDGHSLGLGWDAGRTVRTEERLQRDTTADALPLGRLDEMHRAVVSRMALFAQDEWSVTPRLQAYLGVRWEGTRTSSEDIRGSASVPSPIVQLLWKLPGSGKDQLRLAIARTYKAPAPRLLVPRRFTINNGNSPTNPDVRGNPHLRPELAWGIDTGYETWFGKGGQAAISGHARRIEDATVQTLEHDARGWVATPSNNGRASVAGIEFDARIPLGAQIDARANAARNWSRLDAVPGPDNRLAGQVRASANLGVDYRPAPPFALGANLNLQFGGRVQSTPHLRSNSGPVRVLDLYGTWKIDARSQLRLTVTDALHQDRINDQRFQDMDGWSERESATASRTVVRLALELKL